MALIPWRSSRALGGLVTGALALAAPSTSQAAPCDVQGSVLDITGSPVVGADVQLLDGKAARHTTTDDAGRFSFTAVPSPTEVVVTLADGGPTDRRFAIHRAATPVELRAPVGPTKACAVTLGPEHDDPTTAAVTLFTHLRNGFALMDRLHIRPAGPLRVDIDDPIASADAVYWVGPSSFNPDDAQPIKIVLGTAATRADDLGAPDNREHHELGHHALAAAFGALPRSRDAMEHGGYYLDTSSAGAWTEGFAIFFAAMVAREIEQRPHPGLYRVRGAWLDLEQDYRPWDLRGLESVAVASMLWDMVDGPQPALEAELAIRDPQVLTDAGVPHLLVGRVENLDAQAVADARVRVTTAQWSGTAPVVPAALPAHGEGWFAIVLPEALGSTAPEQMELVASPRPATTDDDPVQVELAALWTAIVELRSDRPQSNGRLFDVADLYQALRGRFGGKDADADGRDDIDQVFVAHGLFADQDGDHQHDPGEALGLTSHPARTVEVAGASVQWPALDPRHRLTLPPGLRASVQTHPADATLAVVVPSAPSGGYVATPDGEGRVWLVAPPAAADASATIIAFAPDRRPTVVQHFEATTLLDELERHDAPFITATVTLLRVPSSARASVGGPWPRLVFVGGAIAALLGLLMVAIGWPRVR